MEHQPVIPTQERREQPNLEPITIEFAKQMIDPPGRDPRISTFCQAVLDIYNGRNLDSDDIGVTRGNLTKILETAAQKDNQASYAVNKILRCFQKQFMYRITDVDYPYPPNDVSVWRNKILTVLSTDMVDEVIADLKERETQSNVVQRYSVLKLIMSLTAERHELPPQILDVGCSQNLGLKKLATGGDFEKLKVMPESGGDNRSLTRRVNRLIAHPISIGRSMGVDLYDLQERANVEWVHACSSYPSELLDLRRQREAYELVNAQVPNVSFVQSDITEHLNISTGQSEFKHERRIYDIIFASTSMYQMTEHQRQRTYENAYKHLKPQGMMIVQDFVSITKGRLRFRGPGSDRYAYRTIVKEKNRDFEDPQELLIWENARCLRLKLGLGKIIVANEVRSMHDLLSMPLSMLLRKNPSN